jgi:hypothetical protein
MFGKKSLVSPLESRKRLLIAESEINRNQMVEEWQTIASGVHSLAAQAKSISSYASAGALLVATVAAFRRSKAKTAGEKPSWFQAVLKGAKLAGSVWLAFRARPR